MRTFSSFFFQGSGAPLTDSPSEEGVGDDVTPRPRSPIEEDKKAGRTPRQVPFSRITLGSH